jgi:hypothetical protein
MIIIKPEVNHFALTTITDKPGLLQNSHLMRNCRLRHIEKRTDIAATHFGTAEGIQNSDSRAITKNPEKIGGIKKKFSFWHSSTDFFNNVFMYDLAVACCTALLPIPGHNSLSLFVLIPTLEQLFKCNIQQNRCIVNTSQNRTVQELHSYEHKNRDEGANVKH